MTAKEPRTEAGRALLGGWIKNPKELWLVEDVVAAILAIEAEARHPEQGRDSGLRVALEKLRDEYDAYRDAHNGWCALGAAHEERGLDVEGSLALTALQEAIRHAGMLRTESVTITAPLARYLAARLASPTPTTEEPE